MSLQKAVQKLNLDKQASRTLDRLFHQALGHAARIDVYLQGQRDPDSNLELNGGGITITLATTTLSYAQALEMCAVLDRCEVEVHGLAAKFAVGPLPWKVNGEILSHFPARPKKGQTLPKGTILVHRSGASIQVFRTAAKVDESMHYQVLFGYYQNKGVDALGVADEEEIQECGGTDLLKAAFEDATLSGLVLANDSTGSDESDDWSTCDESEEGSSCDESEEGSAGCDEDKQTSTSCDVNEKQKKASTNPRQNPVGGLRRDEVWAQLLSATGTLEMTLRGEDSEWRASVPVGESRQDLQPLLRELLFQLHNDGLVKKVSGSESEEKVVAEPGPARPPPSGIVLDVGHIDPDLIQRDEDGAPLEEMDSDMKGLLERARREPVHSLLGLHCFSHREWVGKLLAAVAPHVEVLELDDPELEHLQVVSGMAALRRLRLQGGELWDDAPPLPPQLEDVYLFRGSLDQVLSLRRMPRLRSLTLSYCRWKPFPPLPPHHRGLEYLNIFGSNSHDDHIVFSLIRAHGATLQELRICTATSKPTNEFSSIRFYDDLDTKLAQCSLRSLKCLVLTRSPPFPLRDSKVKASHRAPQCEQQLNAIAKALKQGGATVKTAVLCSVCHKDRLKQSDFPHDDLLVPGLHHVPELRPLRFLPKDLAGLAGILPPSFASTSCL